MISTLDKSERRVIRKIQTTIYFLEKIKRPEYFEFMRLRDMQKTLRNNLEKFAYEFNSSSNNYRIENIQESNISAQALSKIDALQESFSEILSTNTIMNSIVDSMTVDVNLYSKFSTSVAQAKKMSEGIFVVLNSMIPEQDPDNFSIKLPDMESFGDFAELVNDFNNVIFNPLTRIGENVILREFDVGSRWIDIKFKAITGSLLFVQLIKFSFEIYRNDYQKAKSINLTLDMIKSGSEQIDTLHKLRKDQMEAEKTSSSSTVMGKLKESEKVKKMTQSELNELQNSVHFSIDHLVKLIDKGLEVYHAIDAPEEVQKALPDFSKKLEYLNTQKLLDSKEVSNQ